MKTILNTTGSIELRCEVPSKKGFVAKLSKDEFTSEFSIVFVQVASYMHNKLITWADGDDFCRLDFGLSYIGGEHLMAIETYQKSLKFKTGDKLSLLFNDSSLVEFEIVENGYRVDKDEEGVLIETKFPIGTENLNKLEKEGVKKWRYTPKVGKSTKTGTITPEVKGDIKDLTTCFNELIENYAE